MEEVKEHEAKQQNSGRGEHDKGVTNAEAERQNKTQP